MICMILAAGYATRLYPLTENFPKPLLPVAGKPILNHLMDDLTPGGRISGYLVVTNHRFAPIFRQWAATRSESVEILDDGTLTNETRLGAVRDIALALEKFPPREDLLVMAGDNLLNFSLRRFLRYGEEKHAACVMRYYEPDENKLKKCGVLTLGENDRVIKMTEKSPAPATHWCCPPFYFYPREVAARIPQALEEGCGADAPGSLVAWLAEHLPVYAMEMPGQRFDIGTVEGYRAIDRSYGGIVMGDEEKPS